VTSRTLEQKPVVLHPIYTFWKSLTRFADNECEATSSCVFWLRLSDPIWVVDSRDQVLDEFDGLKRRKLSFLFTTSKVVSTAIFNWLALVALSDGCTYFVPTNHDVEFDTLGLTLHLIGLAQQGNFGSATFNDTWFNQLPKPRRCASRHLTIFNDILLQVPCPHMVTLGSTTFSSLALQRESSQT